MVSNCFHAWISQDKNVTHGHTVTFIDRPCNVTNTFRTIWTWGGAQFVPIMSMICWKNVPSIPDNYIIDKKSEMQWEWFILILLNFNSEWWRTRTEIMQKFLKLVQYLHLIDVTRYLCPNIILVFLWRQIFSHSYGQLCCWANRRIGNMPFSVWILVKYHKAFIKLSDFVVYSRVNHIVIWSVLEKLWL